MHYKVEICGVNTSRLPLLTNEETYALLYRCKDGEWFLINSLDYNRDALKIYDLLGLSEEVRALGVVDAATKTEHNVELLGMFQKVFLEKTCAEWVKIFREADIVSGAMSHFRDVSHDEQAWANDFLEEYTTHNGEKCVIARPPIRLRSVEYAPTKLASRPGEQTDEVLRAYGYSEEEIAEMHACGAVK